MIKTFENCSPEYQITIVCFFIFLTLLCMILVIYEGTGKRGTGWIGQPERESKR